MHLSAIHIRGFKSFSDAVEVRLEPGVAVVVGPNGSGKSNVADALLWATGSLSPSELRAEKPDDVLYAGSGDRPAAAWCEVELRFDNADARWEELPFAEVAITRRLHRGGEGQYLVNGATVRRTDLVELLADVGLASGVTVIGQGRVEEILASSPVERRAMIEEAAGVGKFKRRRHRAELKLARVASEVERAKDVEAEVAKRLRPLALQATAAERAERLRTQVASVRRVIDALELAGLEERLAAVEERRAAVALECRRSDEQLEAVLVERNGAEEELADAAGRREGATAALYRLRSAGERVSLRRETAEETLAGLRAQVATLPDSPMPAAPTRIDLARDAAEAERRARESSLERQSLADKLELARGRLEALERSLAEREGLAPAARTLAEAGERLALAQLEVETGYERAVAAALAWRAGALVAGSPSHALAIAEHARRDGLGFVGAVVPPAVAAPPAPPLPDAEPLVAHVRPRPGGEGVASLLTDVWLVDDGRLLDVERGVAVTRAGHRWAPERGELLFAGETAEAVLLELEARRRGLAAETAELETTLASAVEVEQEARRRSAEASTILAQAPVGPPADPAATRRALAVAERLVAALGEAEGAVSRCEAPLRARADAGGERTRELAERLRRLGTDEAELRRRAMEVAARATALEVDAARLESEAAEIRRRLGDEPVEVAENDDGDELRESLDRLERRLDALGQVNPLAKEEYEREQERLSELREQREDLERSLAELETLRAELTQAVDERFAKTFARVRANFSEVAATLFPGGEGWLRLTDPEEEETEVGVELDLRPAGKRVTSLSLLSGGEKALGAISFLFALFLARPSPFYLLDEVEAALDDTNIGRFVDLLRRYADRAQFIVVTHQKRTMEAADVLYGVTMGGEGVSEIVSRRTPREPVLTTAL
ncbi:MAG: chromosome segregation SMC family protein [Gaiellaceae bacterium]